MKNSKRKNPGKKREEDKERLKINLKIRNLSAQYRQKTEKIYLNGYFPKYEKGFLIEELFSLFKNRAYSIIYKRIYDSKKDPAPVDAAFQNFLLGIEKVVRKGTPKGKSKFPLEDPKIDQMNYIYGIMNKIIYTENSRITEQRKIKKIINSGIPLEEGEESMPHKKDDKNQISEGFIDGADQGLHRNYTQEASPAQAGEEDERSLDESLRDIPQLTGIDEEEAEDEDSPKLRKSAGETHPLVQIATSNISNLDPETLALRKEISEIIRGEFKEKLLKVLRIRDPRIIEIVYYRTYRDFSFSKIGKLLYPELPEKISEKRAKNKYIYYQNKLEKSASKVGALKKLFSTL